MRKEFDCDCFQIPAQSQFEKAMVNILLYKDGNNTSTISATQIGFVTRNLEFEFFVCFCFADTRNIIIIFVQIVFKFIYLAAYRICIPGDNL